MTTSYNGWVASQNAASIGVAPFSVNGVSFPSGVKGGDVATVFTHLVQQYAARVEPLITPGCWGYFYKNSANSAALLSCHSSGTAIDLNAPKHPNGRKGSFTPAQVAAIRAILAELGGVVYWGGDSWGGGTTDEMHFEIREGVTVAQVAQVAARLNGAPAPAPAPAPTPWLGLPAVRDRAMSFQRWYNAYPFKPALLPVIAPLANAFGPQSLDALKKVQARYGLVADGIDGPQTKKVLWDLGWRG